jgi:TIR domain-containing protein
VTDPGTSSGRGAAKSGAQKISDAWIFVSHSSSDLVAVRRIRDEIERLGANPILFFLKCMEEEEEIDSLIKREIRARNFFILCDSMNARRSTWVRTEREFVDTLPDKKKYTIDLTLPWERQQAIIREALRAATTFVSYARRDLEKVSPYIDVLIENDFSLWSAGPIAPFDSYQDAIESAIELALAGYFIAFLSLQSLSSLAMEEIAAYERALRRTEGAKPPVLVAIDPVESFEARLPESIRAGNILDFSHGSVADNAPRLLRALGL